MPLDLNVVIKECPACDRELVASAPECPGCGHRFADVPQKKINSTRAPAATLEVKEPPQCTVCDRPAEVIWPDGRRACAEHCPPDQLPAALRNREQPQQQRTAAEWLAEAKKVLRASSR